MFLLMTKYTLRDFVLLSLSMPVFGREKKLSLRENNLLPCHLEELLQNKNWLQRDLCVLIFKLLVKCFVD